MRGAEPPARGERFAARPSRQGSPSGDASEASERAAQTQWIALTGTPGVGKTTLARELRRRGFTVVDLKRFCREAGLLRERDAARGSWLVDESELARVWRRDVARLAPEYSPASRGPRAAFVEGHLAHLLPVDTAIVLRLDPRLLAGRLARRRYRIAKVRENAEAEALDVVLADALAHAPRVFELDTTKRRVESLARSVLRIAEGEPKALKAARVGAVAWRVEALPWF
ncbi:MAG: adenylate kinase family protein [Thermoplasmatota archaeon]